MKLKTPGPPANGLRAVRALNSEVIKEKHINNTPPFLSIQYEKLLDISGKYFSNKTFQPCWVQDS